jgi:type II secretory pathway pseudopilin PulG
MRTHVQKGVLAYPCVTPSHDGVCLATLATHDHILYTCRMHSTLITRPVAAKMAFSLVELSIVLVILGLLIGGILSGQALIRAAELRSITTEYSRYIAATQTFRDKYFALPGDMTNATAFWGKSATYCAGASGTAATPGTCNGNGNGQVNIGSASATAENFEFWKQLAFAGLIEGTYTGIVGPGSAHDTTPGVNAPKGKLSSTGWSVYYTSGYALDPGMYVYDYANMIGFGSVATGSWPFNPALKPEEAWNIDSKIDDGKPATGKVMAKGFTANVGTTSACTTSTSNIDYAGTYRLSNSVIDCTLMFPQAF